MPGGERRRPDPTPRGPGVDDWRAAQQSVVPELISRGVAVPFEPVRADRPGRVILGIIEDALRHGRAASSAARPLAGCGAAHLADQLAHPGGDAVLDVAGPALGR